MEQPLNGKTVAIVVASGFDELGMTEAHRALLKAGAVVRTISPESGLVNGWHGTSWGHYFPVDRPIGEALGADYDMLVLPGGARSIAKLQQNPHTRRIVGHFLDAGKPIAVYGEGLALMAIPGKLRGRAVAVPAELVETFTKAGGRAVDAVLVAESNILSASRIDDLDGFVSEMIRVFAEGSAVKQAA